MTSVEITTLISTVGFPIFVALFFMLTTNRILTDVAKAVEKQTIVLDKQAAMMEKLYDKISVLNTERK